MYAAITAERDRQERKFPGETCRAGIPDALKLTVLVEEVGEVAREILDGPTHSPDELRDRMHAELVQVAAVAVAWLEALEGDGR
ncbi:MAG: hypothetical protein FDZ75_05765 [Actinobacteria bacterium]|nr:MAG: hypothetical protein FDZ75_05765 [Actinomycetota bacterium]